MKRSICVVLSMGAFSCSGPHMTTDHQRSSPDPKEIMARADEATRNVTLISYDAEFVSGGWLTSRVPMNIIGKVIQGPRSKYNLEKFYAEIKLKSAKSDEIKECTVGSNGDVYFLIDPKTYTAYEDMDPAVLGAQSRNYQRVIMREFSVEDPFGDEIKADTIKFLGTSKIGNEKCYDIHVLIGDSSDAVWSISQNDYLPRKVRRIHKNQKGEEGSIDLTLTNLVVNPTFNHDPFTLQVPHGYKKTDEFAP